MIVYNLILFILFNFAISYIVTQSHLFEGLRNWISKKNKFFGELFSCILCFGTWVGFLLSLVYSPSFLLFTNIKIISIFLDGVFGGMMSYILCLLICLMKKSD
jgi:hypothetical protein